MTVLLSSAVALTGDQWRIGAQLLAVFAQPTRLLLPARPDGVEKPPERLAVTWLAEMTNLVNDDVLEHLLGRCN